MDTFLLGIDEFEDLRQKVLVDGKLRHISEFVGDKKRPITLCPICEERVSLKLGNERIHHYAHRPDSTCPMSTGETLVHYNSKMHIAEKLRKANELWILQKCVFCSDTRKVLLVSNWDEVRVEYPIGSLRADIAVLYQGKVIAVIEIWVSHAVEREKADDFKARNIRWVEFIAAPSIYRHPFPWDPKEPLLAQQISPDVEGWICKGCVMNNLGDLDVNFSNLIQRKIGKKVQDGEYIYIRQFLDYFHPNGEHKRESICLTKKWVRGECVSMTIKILNGKALVSVEGSNKNTLNKLKQLFAEYRFKLGEEGVLTHSPTGWLVYEDQLERNGLKKPIYMWSASHKKWIPRPE